MKKIFLGLCALPLWFAVSCSKSDAVASAPAIRNSHSNNQTANRIAYDYCYDSGIQDCITGAAGDCVSGSVIAPCPSVTQNSIFRTLSDGTPASLQDLFSNTELRSYLPSNLLGDEDFIKMIADGVYSKAIYSEDSKLVIAFGTDSKPTVGNHTLIVPFHY